MKDDFSRPNIIHFGCNALFQVLVSLHIREAEKLLCCHFKDFISYRESLAENQILFNGLNGNRYEIKPIKYGSVFLEYDNSTYNHFKEVFIDTKLKALSFSLEKADIKLTTKSKELKDDIAIDIYCNPQNSKSFFGMLCYFLFLRYYYIEEGLYLFTFCSSLSLQMEIKKNFIFIAERWEKEGFVDLGFIEYIKENIIVVSTYIDLFIAKPRIKILQLLHYNNEVRKLNFGSSVFAYEGNGKVLIEENASAKQFFKGCEMVGFTNKDEIYEFWMVCNDKIKAPLLAMLEMIRLLRNEESISTVVAKEEWQWLCYGIGMESIMFFPRYKAYLNEFIQFRVLEYNVEFKVEIKDIVEDLRDYFEDTISIYNKNKVERNLFFIPFFIAIVLRFLSLKDEKLRDIALGFGNVTKRISDRVGSDILHLLYSEVCFDFCWNESILNKIVLFYEEMNKGKDAVIRTLYYFKEVREKWTS